MSQLLIIRQLQMAKPPDLTRGFATRYHWGATPQDTQYRLALRTRHKFRPPPSPNPGFAPAPGSNFLVSMNNLWSSIRLVFVGGSLEFSPSLVCDIPGTGLKYAYPKGGGAPPKLPPIFFFLMDGKYTILLLANGDVFLMMLLLIFNHQTHKYGNASELWRELWCTKYTY